MDIERMAAELAEHIITLKSLPPADRAAQARSLVSEARFVLSRVGDRATAELAAAEGYRAAAETLGLSVAAINKAVSRNNTSQ